MAFEREFAVGWESASIRVATEGYGNGDSTRTVVTITGGNTWEEQSHTFDVRGDWETEDLADLFDAAAKFIRAAIVVKGGTLRGDAK